MPIGFAAVARRTHSHGPTQITSVRSKTNISMAAASGAIPNDIFRATARACTLVLGQPRGALLEELESLGAGSQRLWL